MGSTANRHPANEEHMRAIPADEQLLPPPEQVELVEHLMGCYLSELDGILGTVNDATASVISLDEYVRLHAAGYEFDDTERLDLADLFRILRFAADAINDAATIRDQANEILRVALRVIHERDAPGLRSDSDARRKHEQRMADWHREQARFWSSAS